ncbi:MULTISPECIES: ribonuclease domain-containing protein [unclassified Nocardioides]|uniref:ribonuclease domain-containing protein n=1 Tax=unclassified Nocardioides TaxID=2615069 RepID=UPI0026659B50|nr:ribonuclease domain-containing protein [Nocardioides sp. Arc9.136]WKN50060.1 ribonuclease [Nocardioides sp. Arc9.136]
MPRTSARTRAVASLVVVVLLVVLGALVTGGDPAAPDRATDAGTGTTRTGSSGLPTVGLADLPVEAQETVELIEDGGPFPEPAHDGTVFHNYEGLLPERRDGYYREYTVPTPGLGHRGPRRIVAGEPREYYWTEDHYATFAEVLP